MNHRLSIQIDRLRSDYTTLDHLFTGHRAITKAKETELNEQILELKQLLKESLVERSSLHAQLVAKQVGYVFLLFPRTLSRILTPQFFFPSSCCRKLCNTWNGV